MQRFFDFLQGRVEGRLEEQEVVVALVTAKPTAITQTDIEVIKKVRAILGSPSK